MQRTGTPHGHAARNAPCREPCPAPSRRGDPPLLSLKGDPPFQSHAMPNMSYATRLAQRQAMYDSNANYQTRQPPARVASSVHIIPALTRRTHCAPRHPASPPRHPASPREPAGAAAAAAPGQRVAATPSSPAAPRCSRMRGVCCSDSPLLLLTTCSTASPKW